VNINDTDDDIVVAVIGLGYVGLPLIVKFGRANFRCVSIDLDTAKVDSVRKNGAFVYARRAVA